MSASFRVLGIPVEFRLSFLAMITLIGLPIHPDLSLLSWIAMATIAVLWHELGHAGVVEAFGGSPQIVLLGSGGLTSFMGMGARRHVLIAAAGPAAGLILGALVFALARVLPPDIVSPQLLEDALFITVGWSLINLVPLGTLDGRAMLDNLLTVVLGRPVPAVGGFAGSLIVLGLLVGTAVAGWYVGTFSVAWVALVSSIPFLSGLMGTRQAVDGGSLLAVGEAARALAWTDDVLARGRATLDTWLVRADALRRLTRWSEADDIYSAILTDDPASWRALAMRAITRRTGGRADEANADVEALLALGPTDDDAIPLQVAALAATDRIDEAARLVDERLARGGLDQPRWRLLVGLRAAIDAETGRAEEALVELDRLVVTAPDDFMLHELRAQTLAQLGRLDEACRSAQRSLAGAPTHPEVLETTGVVERLAGHPDTAHPRLLAAAIARPELPRGRAQLAACNLQLGRPDEAVAALRNLAPWAADDPHVRYAQACLAAHAGDPAAAREHLAAAEEALPSLGRLADWDPLLRELRGASNAATG